jgi:hypothetical protein
MRKTFDRRVMPDFVLDFVRACQTRIPCHLGGGAALAGAYLGHRMTGDIDLFVHDAEEMRALVGLLPAAAADAGIGVTLLRDVGHLVRAQLEAEGSSVEVDVVHEPIADLTAPPPPIEGIVIESLTDLRANKLTCIVSRSEPQEEEQRQQLDEQVHQRRPRMNASASITIRGSLVSQVTLS